MRLYWTAPALTDLDDALGYIAADNPQAAQAVGRLIRKKMELLRQFPNASVIGRMENTRELFIGGTSYSVIYKIRPDNKTIEILRIWHEKRQWPMN